MLKAIPQRICVAREAWRRARIGAILAIPSMILLAGAPVRAAKVQASLVSSRKAVVPGESFDAGLLLTHAPKWHTYWKNAGDSGTPTTLEWRLPPGWTASPFEWPTPSRIEAPPLTSFGYGGEALLPLRLTVPAEAPAGVAALRATAEWLECAEICVPGKAELSARVLVSRASVADPAAEAALSAARAALPRPDASAAREARRGEGRAVLVLDGSRPGAEFFPEASAFEGARGPAVVGPARTELSAALSPGASLPERLAGVVVRPGLPAVLVDLPLEAPSGEAARHLALAFLGGLLLNLMPCVFPVLSIKALGLLDRAHGDVRLARRHALAYAAGVIVCFEALAGGILAARAAGASLGWGFQLQSPVVVAALAALFVALGLNLLGLFEVGGRLMGMGAAAEGRGEGLGGSFVSGLFAVVVAAPCTAPFMGAALGWALTRPPAETLAAFAALGAGTAAPFSLLASWPALLRRLPRPGAWMVSLKKLLSLPMFATAAWLFWVLARLLLPAPAAAAGDWAPWSPEAVAEARAAGRTVFVDFTASWCLTCQVNERTTLAREDVRAALARGAAFKADWTARDGRIAAELARHGRNGVPLYVVYPRGGEPVVLPELLTPRLVLDALGHDPEHGGTP